MAGRLSNLGDLALRTRGLGRARERRARIGSSSLERLSIRTLGRNGLLRAFGRCMGNRVMGFVEREKFGATLGRHSQRDVSPGFFQAVHPTRTLLSVGLPRDFAIDRSRGSACVLVAG